MAVAKWFGVLSTTEPRNDVGIIKVRQGNINSEIAEFQIVQNKKPYDLTGLTVYFCASFGLNLVEKPAVVVNTTGGKIQYTFDNDSMQAIGRQKGYFSIKKEGSMIDSTQEFEYQVESSLMSRSIDGKSYIFKLNTLIDVLTDYVKNGQEDFDTWFESVKEILYGVDPGGTILRELIEARTAETGQTFDSLKARLNDFESKTTAQFAQKVGLGTKAEMEDLSDTVISAVTGGATVNVLSIPQNYSVTSKSTTFLKEGKNRFDKTNVVSGEFYFGNGGIGTASGYSRILIELEPNTNFIYNKKIYYSLFTKDMDFVSGKTVANDPLTFNTGSNIKYMGIGIQDTNIDTFMLEVGTVASEYESYNYVLKNLLITNNNLPDLKRDRLYSFKDAWIEWENGSKFPVGFLGDSTTDGAGTSTYLDANRHEAQDLAKTGFGSVDYINTKAFPYLLEQLIKEEIGKTTPRIYNIGYSGTYFDWAKPKLDAIFGGVYTDVKMVGITYGINDRTRVTTTYAYSQLMTSQLEYFINYFYEKGIQPFIVTSQATLEPYDQFEGTYPLRTSEDINSVANRIKREIANKYDLEVIEMTDFGEHALVHSQYPLSQLINDTLHFGDKGNELEAGYLFSEIAPRTIVTDSTLKLGFSSQRVKSFVPAKKGTTIHYLSSFEDGFKVKAMYTKTNTNDLLLQDFWVLNYSKTQLELKAFITSVHTQYVKLNGSNITINSNGQLIGTLDVGLHHIQAYSGQTTEVDFKGFTLN